MIPVKLMMKVQTKMTILTNKLTLDELSDLCTSQLKETISGYFSAAPSLDLKTAMRYTMQQGGKHLRPLLIYATGTIFKAPAENLAVPAAAVELIHTYSLIHDDLPCMDNADLRRGQPTCHKTFGDGLAMLTGDALHTLAMQIMAEHPAKLNPAQRLQMIQVLSRACGPFGMAAGQALDMTDLSNPDISTDLLLAIYHLKTGALFTACLELGRIAALDDDEQNESALCTFGNHIGLAFQIQDDLLDIEVSAEASGKPQGLDANNNKMTYPRLLGISLAKTKVESLYQNALESIDYLGDRASLLRELTKKMLRRNR